MKLLHQFIVLMGVIALAALHYPIPIFGQTTLAIRGGMSRATVGGSDAKLAVALIGITLGASATIPIQEKFSLQLGGDYVQKGYRNLGFTTNVDYIELSGLGASRLAAFENQASVYMFVGPSVAFNIRCGASFSSPAGILYSPGISVSDCGEGPNSFDFGITGGVGAEKAISEQLTFSVNLLYTMGLLLAAKEADIKNRTLILRAGVGFPIRK